MMYVVMYFEGWVGYHETEEMRVFADRVKAEAYAEILNAEVAKENECEVKDLGDYFDVIEVEIA